MKHTGCIHMDPKTVPNTHQPGGKAISSRDYHDLIDALADKVEAKIIEIRHDLHKNPELPNREFRTAGIIADHLKALDFDEVLTEVGVTGVVYLFLGGQDTRWTENGIAPIDPAKPIPFNHNPHYYVKDEVLKTGIRMHANVVMDFLTGQMT